jgi:L-threonylcarbamoyladenylate synthase
VPQTRLPRILAADPSDPATFDAAIDEGAAVIRAGGLVAFPTETVYGLGANALSAEAVRAIFAAKGRPAFNPVIVHLADALELDRVARDVPPVVATLARAFWPGPLTLVVPRREHIPDVVTAGLPGVGVRVPAHPVARALIARAGVPIAAPSANPFTCVSPTTAAHVATQMGSAVPLILDGGPTRVGIESTVLDVTGARPLLLRPGGVSREDLERVIGPIDVESHAPSGDAPRPSPGMIERHYAPRARLEPADTRDPSRVAQQAAGHAARGEKVAIVFHTGSELPAALSSLVPAPLLIPMSRDPEGYARALYAALHAIDAASCQVALVEPPPADPSWEAVADRLRRAGLPPRR